MGSVLMIIRRLALLERVPSNTATFRLILYLQDKRQHATSLVVIFENARLMAAALRKRALIMHHMFPIGLKSGE